MPSHHIYFPEDDSDRLDDLVAALSHGCVTVSRSAVIREALAHGLPAVAKAHGVDLRAAVAPSKGAR